MRCDVCKKRKAAIHVTQDLRLGESVCVDLCAKCAELERYDENDFSAVFRLLDAKMKDTSK
jgi:protein-arginine kinase activator protein McsA